MNGSVEGRAAKAPPASKVGNNFVKAYYKILVGTPQEVHNFYGSVASFVHLEKGQKSSEANNVRGKLNIAEAVKKLNYAGRKIDIENIDCQESVNGSVLVVVTGSFCKDGSSYRRAFSQTFVLTAENGAYFVHNDVLRFLNDEEAAPKPKSSKSSKESKAARAAKAEDKKKEVQEKKKEAEDAKAAPAPAPANPAAKPEAAASQSKADKKPERPEKKEKQKRPKKESKQAAPAPVAAPAPTLNWAARVAANKPPAPAASAASAASAAAAAAPNSAEAPAASNEGKATEAKSAKNDDTANSAPAVEVRGDGFKEVSRTKRAYSKRDSKKQEDDEEISAAIYVKNLPAGTGKAEVIDAFKKFGAVKDVQMFKEKSYCFVHFAAAGSVDTVLAAAASKPVKIGDAELSIDRKKRRGAWVDREGSRRGRFRGRGRGGNRGRRSGEGRSEGSA